MRRKQAEGHQARVCWQTTSLQTQVTQLCIHLVRLEMHTYHMCGHIHTVTHCLALALVVSSACIGIGWLCATNVTDDVSRSCLCL